MRLLALVVTMLVAVPLAAQQPTTAQGADSLRTVINGTVRDSLGLPIAGASVVISPEAIRSRR